MQGGKVVGAIAEQGHAFLGEMGKRQFAQSAFRQLLACVGIQNFGIEIILTQVRATLAFTFVSYARPAISLKP